MILYHDNPPPTPKGLNISAQGCEARATLGSPSKTNPNPVRVASKRLTTRWSIGRRKTKNGATYPIRLTFIDPLAESAVRQICNLLAAGGDSEWKGFKYFDIRPTPKPRTTQPSTLNQ